MSSINNIYQEQSYQNRFMDYQLWKEKADQLIKAATLLEPDIKDYWSKLINKNDNKSGYKKKTSISRFSLLQDIYFMLNAYALENYFKAIIVKDLLIRNKIQNKIIFGKIPREIKTHDLNILAKHARFKANKEEDILLTRLESNSIWQGRYPIPTDSKDLSIIQRTSSGQLFQNIGFYSSDLYNINTLINHVQGHVQQSL